MDIMFSCLPGLASFLLVRDDYDFEAILSKGVVSGCSSLLQILGSFVLEDPKDTNFMDIKNEVRTKSASTSATGSSCATSDKTSIINLSIEASFVNHRPAASAQVNTQWSTYSHNLNFRSTLLQQDWRYFCPSIKCYKTSWATKYIESNFFVNCRFYHDRTVSKEHLKHFCILTWTKRPSPLPKKWTRDIHNVGNNLP